MKAKTETILQVMNVLTWIVFIGLCIKMGALLISFLVSFANPIAAQNLYKGLNLFPLREQSFWNYTSVVAFMMVSLGLKAYAAFLVIKIMSKMNLNNPFTMEIAMLIEKLSYIILDIWIIALVANLHNGFLQKHDLSLSENLSSGEFIFLAGVIFIIAQIFKKGIEIQSENELTI
jgi:hypothetical protein